MSLFKNYKQNTATSLWGAVFFMLLSCEDEAVKMQKNKTVDFPDRVVHNTYIIRRDSGRVVLSLKAPIIEDYTFVDSPYIEAKKGIYLEYFDKKNPKSPGKVWAKYAKYDKLKELYIAKGNVKIITKEQQTFASQSIFWDTKEKKMYTSDTVFVTDKDGTTLVGANGMVATDDFSEYTFNNNTGSFTSKGIPKIDN